MDESLNPKQLHGIGYIAPGTRVRRDATVVGWGEEEVHSEWGVVLECWFDELIQEYDCWIAFDRNTFDGPTPEVPYVLRYAAMGLNIVDE